MVLFLAVGFDFIVGLCCCVQGRIAISALKIPNPSCMINRPTAVDARSQHKQQGDILASGLQFLSHQGCWSIALTDAMVLRPTEY